MARSLCELQLELQCPTSTEFVPRTPVGKETKKRKIKSHGKSRNVTKRCAEVKAAIEADATLLKTDQEFHQKHDTWETSNGNTESPYHIGMGNFPSPKELASLDVNFLGKRCNLGYRASRILGLAQGVINGKIQLRQFEEDFREPSLSNYVKINEQLRQINGFGPFTRANVLMCLGFYHVIPSDSETLRHLNQVHGKKSTMKNIEHDIEMIYGKYAPFQFLVYWSEIWSFYEQRFGKLSELPNSDYKLITAANLRSKGGVSQRSKVL